MARLPTGAAEVFPHSRPVRKPRQATQLFKQRPTHQQEGARAVVHIPDKLVLGQLGCIAAPCCSPDSYRRSRRCCRLPAVAHPKMNGAADGTGIGLGCRRAQALSVVGSTMASLFRSRTLLPLCVVRRQIHRPPGNPRFSVCTSRSARRQPAATNQAWHPTMRYQRRWFQTPLQCCGSVIAGIAWSNLPGLAWDNNHAHRGLLGSAIANRYARRCAKASRSACAWAHCSCQGRRGSRQFVASAARR